MRKRPTWDEIMQAGDLGWEVYANEIEPTLTESDARIRIAIDVDTGRWAIGDNVPEFLEARTADARILHMSHLAGDHLGLAGAIFTDVESQTEGRDAA